MAKQALAPLVVFHPDRLACNAGVRTRRMIPAWIISIIVHVAMLAAFLMVNVSVAETPLETEPSVFVMQVEEDAQSLNLDNDNIGENAALESGYDVERIGDSNMPGPVDLREQVAIRNAPAGPMMALSPPSGVNRNGTSSGVDEPFRFGPGSLRSIKLANSFGARGSGATKVRMLIEGGGNKESEAAVSSGLKWFRDHQDPNGSWSFANFHRHGDCGCTGQSNHNDIAATSFALLPFLAGGFTHKEGPHIKVVDRGLNFLMQNQRRDGELHTQIPNEQMYTQGLAAMVLCEAYGLTSAPSLRGPAQRAINYLVDAQSGEGGWRYQRRQAGYDTSVSGWQLMALKSGQMAGLDVPTRTLKACSKWLDDAATPDGGSYGYTRNDKAGPTTSAVGLLCRQYLGWGPRHPGLLAGVERLQKAGPNPANMYYTYYASQVMHHMGGGAWEAWNPTMRDGLIAAQDKGHTIPHQKGSWDSHKGHAGRIMDTSLSLLTLEVYYRYLPLYRRDVGSDKPLMDSDR